MWCGLEVGPFPPRLRQESCDSWGVGVCPVLCLGIAMRHCQEEKGPDD